jgi:hypothetical protein
MQDNKSFSVVYFGHSHVKQLQSFWNTMVKTTSTAPSWVNDTESRDIKWEDLSKHFMSTMDEAANNLGVSEKYLRKVIRNFGVKRWPRRQIITLGKKKERILSSVRDAIERGHKIENVDRELTKIFKDTYSSVEIKPRRNKSRNQKDETNEPTVQDEIRVEDNIELDMDEVLRLLE